MQPWDGESVTFDETTFSGVVRLFPLPNLVLFPHVVQPLHIFEDRYREMLEDALSGDGLIGMSVLEPGWEPDYEGRPPIASHACLGKVLTHRRLNDGRYNLMLLGVRRVRVVRELDPLRSFRQAEVQVLHDCYADQVGLDPERLKRELFEAFRHHLPEACQVPDQLDELLSQHVPLGVMTDLVAYTLPFDLTFKKELLAECRVELRAQWLLEQMGQLQGVVATGRAAIDFPPPFSVN